MCMYTEVTSEDHGWWIVNMVTLLILLLLSLLLDDELDFVCGEGVAL